MPEGVDDDGVVAIAPKDLGDYLTRCILKLQAQAISDDVGGDVQGVLHSGLPRPG